MIYLLKNHATPATTNYKSILICRIGGIYSAIVKRVFLENLLCQKWARNEALWQSFYADL